MPPPLPKKPARSTRRSPQKNPTILLLPQMSSPWNPSALLSLSPTRRLPTSKSFRSAVLSSFLSTKATKPTLKSTTLRGRQRARWRRARRRGASLQATAQRRKPAAKGKDGTEEGHDVCIMMEPPPGTGVPGRGVGRCPLGQGVLLETV